MLPLRSGRAPGPDRAAALWIGGRAVIGVLREAGKLMLIWSAADLEAPGGFAPPKFTRLPMEIGRTNKGSRYALVPTLWVWALVAACGVDVIVDDHELEPGQVLTSIVILPRTATVEPGDTVSFVTLGVTEDFDSVAVFPTYTATGGTVSVGGTYVAGGETGEFTVTARDEETGLTSGATVTIQDTSVPIVGFFIAPASITIAPAGTFSFLAFGVTSAGDTTGVSAEWSATGGTITSGGVFTAGPGPAQGRVIGVRAPFADTSTVQITAPPSQGSTPDPTLLPVATTLHVPQVLAYTALNVPGMAVGQSYADPTTGVRVYRLTNATFPTNSPNWGHDYSEGGNEVSLPWQGEKRSVLVRQNGQSYWLIDFTPQSGPGGSVGAVVDNPRRIPTDLSLVNETAFTFSSNPATPYYAFVANGTQVKRFDIRTMAEAPGDGWPVNAAANTWLHQSYDDAFFTWQTDSGVAQGYEPSTGTLKSYAGPNASGVNEPRIDRGGRYIGLVMDNPDGAIFVWDWQTNQLVWNSSGVPPFGHNASLRRLWIGVDVYGNYPPDFTAWRPDVLNSAEYFGGPANASAFYGNGNWNQPNTPINDQWALFSNYGGVFPISGDWGWLAPGGMVYITYNGQRRLLGHPYSSLDVYTFYSFVKQAPDGLYVQFTSDMNASGRSDVFLVEVPTR